MRNPRKIAHSFGTEVPMAFEETPKSDGAVDPGATRRPWTPPQLMVLGKLEDTEAAIGTIFDGSGLMS